MQKTAHTCKAWYTFTLACIRLADAVIQINLQIKNATA